jgi:hypothetical protein
VWLRPGMYGMSTWFRPDHAAWRHACVVQGLGLRGVVGYARARLSVSSESLIHNPDTLNTEHQTPNTKYQTPNTKHQTLNLEP